ncbi:deoxyribonuclease IV [Aminobacterium sp. MB27-C1]|jgi:deoxyribonuclease-4|nr:MULTISPECIES: deoxyribonuclease IV [unclassified Aminobacterium]MEA4878147.1 deoxyribonuclease IV [Aminobacterium sp.]WMI70514.1 deoxyribonuclease IV [Aminobacterium sp. MB27-C1]
MPLIGAHVSIAGGLERAIERGEDLECEAIQMFTKNQLQWHSTPISMSRAERFLHAWRRSGIQQVVVHASYLINLASPDETREKSIVALTEEVERCDMLGIDEIVVHPGSSRGRPRDEGIGKLVNSLGQVLQRTSVTRVRILIETMAGQGSILGSSLDELKSVLDHFPQNERLGLCLDTCHLFAAGYELRTFEAYERFVSSLMGKIGLERVGCWHLNDSAHARNSHLDRHQHIGEGELGVLPFSFIVNDSRWNGIPALLETPQNGLGNKGNLTVLRKLRGG